jgi:hypothetical protein
MQIDLVHGVGQQCMFATYVYFMIYCFSSFLNIFSTPKIIFIAYAVSRLSPSHIKLNFFFSISNVYIYIYTHIHIYTYIMCMTLLSSFFLFIMTFKVR